MVVNKDTRVFDILETYGDIAGVMEVLGVKSIGKYNIRRIITRFLSVERAAKIHKVPLDEFIQMLNKAIKAIK